MPRQGRGSRRALAAAASMGQTRRMGFFDTRSKLAMPSREDALPGRKERMVVPASHFVSGARLEPPFPAGTELAMFGMGCFWGAERKFWQAKGVYSTSVGYAAGYT